MADHIREQIAKAILARLAVIATPGYLFTIDGGVAIRPPRFGMDQVAPKHLKCYLLQGDPEIAADPQSQGCRQWQIRFVVGLFYMTDASSSVSIDEALNNAEGEIHRALWGTAAATAPGIAAQPPFGVTGCDTAEIGASERFQLASGFTGFELPIDVTYRHIESDPRTA